MCAHAIVSTVACHRSGSMASSKPSAGTASTQASTAGLAAANTVATLFILSFNADAEQDPFQYVYRDSDDDEAAFDQRIARKDYVNETPRRVRKMDYAVVSSTPVVAIINNLPYHAIKYALRKS